MSVQDEHLDPPEDKAGEWAQGILDDWNTEECIEEAIARGLLMEDSPLFKQFLEALRDDLRDEYEEGYE